MFLKFSDTSNSLLLDARFSRIIIRLLFNPSVIISVLARKVVLDIIGISYFVVSLIMFKIRPPSDIIFSSISMLLILRL